MKDMAFLLGAFAVWIAEFFRPRTKHLARVVCHRAVATPEIVLGGKTDQNLGSLPPKLRVLSATFSVVARFASCWFDTTYGSPLGENHVT
jgi:hypothetical protein